MDLFKIEDVVRVAETVRSDHQTIDSLILNAGIMMPKFKLTNIGIESQMQINFVSNKIFVDILLPLVMCSPNGKPLKLREFQLNFKNFQFFNISSKRKSDMSFVNRSSMVISRFQLDKDVPFKVKLWVRYDCLWLGSFKDSSPS